MSVRKNPESDRDTNQRPQGFDVSGWMDWAGGLVANHPKSWIALGKFESKMVDMSIDGVRIDRPIYVTGLARSGSTILLEILARHPEVATHRYRDFPFLFTPYFWNRFLDLTPGKTEEPAERSHADGIAVTSESPEAFEEVLWMAYFSEIHDPLVNAVMDRSKRHPAFEHFYREHIRKLLGVRNRGRYVSKGNYNVTRLGYLAEILPDARFLIPVRDPIWHIASLMKQHKLFLAGQTGNDKAVRHLQRVGHFEFGVDRRPINTGDTAEVREVQRLWREGEELRGWAKYWALIHNHIADLLGRDTALKQAAMIARFEDVCERPRELIAAILEHCQLPASSNFLDESSARIRFPGYYRPRFDSNELDIIAQETRGTAKRFGYDL